MHALSDCVTRITAFFDRTFAPRPSLPLFGQVMVLLCVLLVLMFRAPYEFLTPQLWAEDGRVFLCDARTQGLQSLFLPYAGYQHALIRICAFFAHGFPLELIPRVYFLCALGAILFACFYVMRIAWIPPFLKMIFPFAVVVAPENGEVFFTLTNIHWVLSVLIPLIALTPPAHTLKSFIPHGLLLLLLGLTGPHCIIFLPLFLVRFVVNRKLGLYNQLGFLIIVACVCVQVANLIHNQDPHVPMQPDRSLAHWFEALIVRPGAGLFLGMQIGEMVHVSPGLMVPVGVPLAIFGGLAGYALFTGAPILTVFLGIAAVAFLSVFYRLMNEPLLLAPFVAGDRYYYLPYVFMSFAFIWLSWSAQGWRQKVGLVGCCLILLSATSVFQMPRKVDLQWADRVKALKTQETVRIPLNPNGWSVELHR